MSEISRLDRLKRLALQRGGMCLSEAYVRSTQKLKWRCAAGHEWEATPQSVRNTGNWCRTCSMARVHARLRQEALEGLQKLAETRGGACLATAYQNRWEKLSWRCAKGHEWEATTAHVRSAGTWCPVCAHERRSHAQRGRGQDTAPVDEALAG